MNIVDKLRKESGGAVDIPAPNPDNPRQWRRMFCPFCDPKGRLKKPSAELNYELDRFICHRANCGRKVAGDRANRRARVKGTIVDKRYPESATASLVAFKESQSVFDYYAPAIVSAVKAVARKLGDWTKDESLRKDTLTTKALGFLWDYSQGDPLGPNDSGRLDSWDAQSNGDTQKLYAFVVEALKGDLLDYAKVIVREKNRQGMTGVSKADSNYVSVSTANPLPTDDRSSVIELDWQNRKDGVHQDDSSDLESKGNGGRSQSKDSAHFDRAYWKMADNERMAFKSWGGPVLKCTLTRNGSGPIAGHCAHCDAKLNTKELAELRDWLDHRGGMSHWNWTTGPTTLAASEWGKLTSPESKTDLNDKLESETADKKPEDYDDSAL